MFSNCTQLICLSGYSNHIHQQEVLNSDYINQSHAQLVAHWVELS